MNAPGDRSAQAQPRPSVRRHESRQIIGMLEEIDRGQSRIVELIGEPGIGKTRLLADLTAEARRRGITALTGRYTEFEQHIPFRAISHLVAGRSPGELSGVFPGADLSQAAFPARAGAPHNDAPQTSGARPADLQRFHIYQAVRTLLVTRSAGNGMVLVLDDFHWADAGSVELIDYLVRWPIDAPLLLVIAQRTRQASVRLRSTLAHGSQLGSVTRIELGALNIEQSAEILGLARPDQRLRELHRESQGIPLYLLALAHAKPGRGPGLATTCAEIPEQYSSLLMGEMDCLSPLESGVAAAAAVLGDQFDVAALATIAELPHAQTAKTVDRLMRRDLFRGVDQTTRLAFRHAVPRCLLYANLDPTWRIAAHRRVVAMLSAQNASATERAAHVERCLTGPDPDDFEVLVQAAEDTLESSPSTAAHWLRVALRALPDGDETTTPRAELLLKLAGALGAAGELSECRTLLHDIVDMSPAASADVRFAAVGHCALLECFLGHNTEAEMLLTAELAALSDPLPPVAAGLLVERGIVQLLTLQTPAVDRIELALRMARGAGDRLVEAGALALLGFASAFGGDVSTGGDQLAACAAILDQLDDGDLASHPEYLAMLGWAEIFLGRLAEAKRHFDRGIAVIVKSAHTCVLPTLFNGLSNTYRHMGRFADARQAADDAKESSYEINGEQVGSLTLALQALIAAWADPEDARAAITLANTTLARLAPDADASPSVWHGISTMALATAAWVTGDARRCIDSLLLAGGGPTLPDLPQVLRPGAFEMLTDAGMATGEPAAADWAEQAMAVADRLGLPHLRAQAMLAGGHLARGRHDPHTAAAHYRAAADLLHAASMAGMHAWALSLAGACAIEAGEPADAVPLLRTSREVAARCGATRIVEHVEKLEGRLNAPELPATEAGTVLNVLTVREREIATLAGTGKRTREIAGELVLSPRTVDVHLTRIYRKLNVRSRAALARLMAQLG